MSTADFNRALAHPDFQGSLGAAVCAEVHFGLAGDTRVLLCAAVEGVICQALPDYRRATYLDCLSAARLLAKDAVVKRRLWSETEQAAAVAAIESAESLPVLLDYWVRARNKYRERERGEAAGKVRYADGRPFDLSTLKAA